MASTPRHSHPHAAPSEAESSSAASEANPWRRISDAEYDELRSRYAGLHPKKPVVAPTELQLEPDGSSWTARENLTDIITREILGPRDGDEETLTHAPDMVYFVGRIAPKKLKDAHAPRTALLDQDEADDVDEHPTEPLAPQEYTQFDSVQSRGVPVHSLDALEADPDQDSVDDEPQRRGLMIPASMGLRLVVDRAVTATFKVLASWATYERRVQKDRDSDKAASAAVETKPRRRETYTRIPHDVPLAVSVDELTPNGTRNYPLDGTVILRIDRFDVPGSTRSIIEIALCNDFETPQPIPTEAWLFQTRLDVTTTSGAPEFLPIADPLGDPVTASETTRGFEDLALDLQYRNRLEYAVGRTCSTTWVEDETARRASKISTTWLPTYEIAQVKAELHEGVRLDMMELAEAPLDGIIGGLTPLVDGYTDWLRREAARGADLPEHLQETLTDCIERAHIVRDGLQAGLDELQANPEAVQAFRFMNRCMAEQRIHTQVAELRGQDPSLTLAEARSHVIAQPYAHSWRMFQLAFVLLNIAAMSHADHPDRAAKHAAVNLLFFPTGGGKTEAYLGLAAFTFAIRRLQGEMDTPDGYLDGTRGVAVLMRYTLRLLTAQQFQRATTLICAAETIRQEDPDTWGDEPFRIGLWVGASVTPKRFDEAKRQLEEADGRRERVTVLQLQVCPWCGEPLTEKNVTIDTTTRRVQVFCPNDLHCCPFSKGHGNDDGIPVLTTDEEIYRLTPTFLVATVDKFARLAREGAAAAIFGYVDAHCERHGYTHPDDDACGLRSGSHRASKGHPAAKAMPCDRLRPIDLIIQDELHLITGALGTTVGLFETAVDVATTWTTPSGTTAKPLIVASTATVRNAAKQVQHLFGRHVRVFPPQVLDVNETYFSTEIPVTPETPGRRYLGVSTTGVRLTSAEVKISAVLLAAGQHLLDTHGGKAADPYMTLVGYFNATRELGGYARYLRSDISTALRRGSASGLPRRLWGLAKEFEATELTSRVSGSDIGKSLRDLAIPFTDDSTSAGRQRILDEDAKYYPEGRPTDVVMATSMLQVGVDVTRLGLMLMVGQPKNTAEYIQASSRVGRDAHRPGLVVALGNWARPRDLAHYEQFRHYHATFYSQVEALSITPFSLTSMERGLAGAVISAARVLTAHHDDGLSPNASAGNTAANAEFLETLVTAMTHRIAIANETHDPKDTLNQLTGSKLRSIIDRWEAAREEAVKGGRSLAYTVKEKQSSTFAPLVADAEEVSFGRSATGAGPFAVANSMREVQPEISLHVSPLADRLTYREPAEAPRWTFTAKDDA